MTCEEIKREIEELKKSLIKQINDNDLDMKEIMKNIIKVSSKYPEQKELIEFIIMLNDALNRESKNIKNDIIDIIDVCFVYKIKLLDKVESLKKESVKTSTFKNKVKTITTNIKNMLFGKLIIPLIIIAFIFALYIMFPEQADHFFKEIFPKISKII